MKLNELLGDPAWLFDLGFPIKHFSGRLVNPDRLEWELADEYRIPALSSLSGGRRFAEMSIGWHSTGLFFHSRLRASSGKEAAFAANNWSAKTQSCSVYIDTRWSPGVHRATSFCHRFDFLLNRPTSTQPVVRGHGELNPIQRARAAPANVHPSDISVATFFRSDGYDIKAYLKGEALTGFSPEEFQEIGIFYTINDSILGTQIMARTLQSPYFEDPNVWCRGQLLQAQT